MTNLYEKYYNILKHVYNLMNLTDNVELKESSKKTIINTVNQLIEKDNRNKKTYESILVEFGLKKEDTLNNTQKTNDNSNLEKENDVNITNKTQQNLYVEKVEKNINNEQQEYYSNEYVTLNNGLKMPSVVFGTWRMWQEPSGGYNPTLDALNSGCRAVDTAQAYNTEIGVGQAIKDSGIPREQIFLSSKFEPDFVTDYNTAKNAFENTLKNLNTPYVDVMYIHAPSSWNKTRKNDNEGIYKFLEEEVQKGRIKAIGLSNFTSQELDSLISKVNIKPAIVQCSYSIGNRKYEDVVSYCKEHNIQILPYSPIASGYLLDSDNVSNMATKNNVSKAQLCLDYVGKKFGCFVFGSENIEHIKENLQTKKILKDEDMNNLDKIIDDRTMWSYGENFNKEPRISSIYLNRLKY